MKCLFLNDLLKIFKRSMFKIEMLVVLVALILTYTVMTAMVLLPDMKPSGEVIMTSDRDDLRSMIVFPSALSLKTGIGDQMLNPGGLVAFLVFILASSVVAQEYQWRTLHLVASRGVARWQIIVSRFLALVAAAVLMFLICLVLIICGAIVTTLIVEGSLASLSQVNWLQVFRTLFVSLLGILPYLAVICFMATLTRSVIATMAAYLFFVIAELTLVQVLATIGAGSSHQVRMLLPSELYKMLLAWSTGHPPVLNPFVAACILLGMTIGILVLSIATLHRQDLPAL